MFKRTVFVIALLSSQVCVAAANTVEAFLADPVSVLDEQGKVLREIPRKDAPTRPLPVLQYNEGAELVQVDLNGQKVWLDPVDLRIKPPLKIVTMPCEKLNGSEKGAEKNHSTMGFGEGCNK
jgi:hypothetical protein